MGNRLVLGFTLALILLSPSLFAQSSSTTPSDSSRLAKLEQATADAKSSADNAWMLTSSALVLMMTGPGLALFYGGLVRKKNVLGTMMQSFAMMAVITVLWALVELQPGVWIGERLHWRTSSSVSARRRRCSPMRTMPRPFRCRPSWSIS